MHMTLCENLVTSSPYVEAAILFTPNNEPVWHTRGFHPVDAIVEIVQNLLSAAGELHLFDTAEGASVTFGTRFGALYIRAINADTLLALCLLDGYSLQTINKNLEHHFSMFLSGSETSS